jgi:hypothetical protein
VHEFESIQKRAFKDIENLRFLVGGSHGLRSVNALFTQAKFVVTRGIFKANE